MIWFSSDHHFSHFNVIRYSNRPFTTVEEMNEEMVRRWNARVKPEDTVYYLGDFSLSRQALTTYLPRLNGEKHLIAGNHDHCHPVHYKKEAKGERMRALYLETGFSSVALEDSILIEIPGRPENTLQYEKVKLHHMPYSGDHVGEERYTEWRPKDEGGWLLHGHVHEKWIVKDRMINVGVDAWQYEPVSIDSLRSLIQGAHP